MDFLMIYLLIINFITFCIYGFDKWRAKRDAWRVPEKTLLILAAIGGSIGALFGMYFFVSLFCLTLCLYVLCISTMYPSLERVALVEIVLCRAVIQSPLVTRATHSVG